MTSRREFFRLTAAATIAAWAAHPLWTWAADADLAIPGKDGMIVRSSRFVDLESPVEYFDSWITPVPHFFVRNHMHEPIELGADGWTVSISGEVEKPYTLTLPEISKLDHHTVVNTLECAGNGRAYQNPKVPGVQWGKGAVGNARYAGPRLRDILQRAGVKPSGKHVMFRGNDAIPGNVPPSFAAFPSRKLSTTTRLSRSR